MGTDDTSITDGELAHAVSDRGFVHMEPVKGTDNSGVRVYQSSGVHSFWQELTTDGKEVVQGEAEGPFIWMRVWGRNNGPFSAKQEVAAHLPVDAARTLRDQLSWLIDHSGE